SALPVDLEVAKFDLMLTLGESAAGLTGTLEYDADLFDRSTAARLLSHLGRLLDEIAADPARRISEMPLLAPAERHQLLVEWNDSAADYAGAVCLHELVEAQVERSPDAVAVSFEGEELSYAELERRSNLLAHRLRELGVGPEVPVAMCVERSLAMMVGLLAVLKAGGAYVPLDPDYPSGRLAFMIEDSSASLLLAQSHLVLRLPAGNTRVLLLDGEDGAAALGTGGPAARPVGDAVPDSLLYVIYTSGSTGRPKGVMVRHQGVVNRLLWAERAYPVTSADRILQKAPFSFDFSVWECFGPLLAGARLVLARPGGQRDGRYLARTVMEQGITLLHFVPAMLQAFLEEEGLEGCRSLRFVFSGGDALSSEVRDRFRARLPQGVLLRNQYGPTEISIDVTEWICVPEETGESRRQPPIGRPLGNGEAYIADAELAPAPVGVAGELLLGGEGVARGYRGRPDLTAERFIPAAWSGVSGARVYRTGDRARWLPDGTLEFLGRSDQQFKIRGYRIEPGEIESTLGHHPAVAASAVMVREDTSAAERRLVGYVAVRPGEDVTVGDLRSFLSASLPPYMVPAVFVLLAALPLNPNGKVDFHSLPAPGHERPELDAAMTEATSWAETLLARIWAEVLHLDRVGVRDNFFELGGDSILSIQIVARANQAGLRLTPHQVFQHQTIAELAAVAGLARAVDAEQGLVTGPVPLTPIQRRFLGDDPVDAHHFNQSLLLQSGQSLDPVRLEQVTGHLLAHHDALRLRFFREREGWRQRNDPIGRVPFHRVDLAGLPASRRATSLKAAAAQAQASLNLSDGPLLRAVFFTLGGEKGERLLLALHHLVVDGVSWRILLSDLETAYTQISRGQAVRLPLNTTSFKSWAERLAGHAEELRSESGYWLAGPRMQAARLPLDGTGNHDAAWSPATLSVSLGTEE
ncbi:MAG TPA: amino acid adenylation domain-containing protein, partial [Thermoanaerobaculia bacterium]|nr:amino acid adenylation domain-containing protein [Thermoanaerobaculia bacterium]